MPFVFVYGTLKRGYRNNILLSHSRFVQAATTKPFYKLFDCGSYPCMVEAKRPAKEGVFTEDSATGQCIVGEVWEVDDATMKRLDQLEGVPWLYQRGDVKLLDFAEPTIAYFYQEDYSDFPDCGTSWPRQRPENILRKTG